MKLIGRRIIAFVLDYLVVLIYAMVLFGITTFVGVKSVSPLKGQIIGFFSITLPVFLYFYFMEKSTMAATFGKRVMGISVFTSQENKPRSIFLRNFLKFLPWEIAHIGVHWIVYYSALDISPPLWVWVTLVLPQLTVFGYLVSVVVCKGESSLYDRLAHTRVRGHEHPVKE